MLATRALLRFRLDAPPGSPLAGKYPQKNSVISSPGLDELRRRLVKQFKFHEWNGVWLTIDLQSSGVRGLATELEDLRHRGMAVIGMAWIEQEIKEPEKAEWCMLSPAARAGAWRAGAKDYPRCECCTIDEEVEVAGNQPTIVSERFVEVVKAAGLRGLEFLHVSDSGRFQARRWYLPVSFAWLGERADRPRIKRDAVSGKFGDPVWPDGKDWLSRDELASLNPYQGAAVAKLLSVIPDADKNFALLPLGSAFLFKRADLPESDFGYIASGIYEQHQYPGRSLCFTARVRELLLKNGLISGKECEPIDILDGGERLTTDTSRTGARVFVEEEFGRLREAEAEAIETTSNGKTERSSDFEEVLRRFEAQTGRPTSMAKYKQVESDDRVWGDIESQLGVQIPREWRRIAEASCGSEEGEAWAFDPDQIVERNRWIESGWRDGVDQATYAGKYLHVASSGGGDWFSLHRDGSLGVVMFDHEGPVIARRWECIAHFVEEMLIKYETEGSDGGS